MTTEYRSTPEEEAHGRLLDKKWETLSGTACTMIKEAQLAAYATNMVHNYCGFQLQEYEEAMETMRRAAGELADQEREVLLEVVHTTRTAAASIDPEDRTPAGYKVDRGDVHRYYEMVSGMLEDSISEETFFVRTPQNGG